MSRPSQYLLDTNILLAYVRGGEIGRYVERTYHLLAGPFQPLVCVVSIGEIRAIAAAQVNPWAKAKTDRMNELIGKLVVVDISEPAVLDGYVVAVNRRPKGLGVPQNDLWIASAAMATQSCLLTTDRHFDYLADQGLLTRQWIDPAVGKIVRM